MFSNLFVFIITVYTIIHVLIIRVAKPLFSSNIQRVKSWLILDQFQRDLEEDFVYYTGFIKILLYMYTFS